MFSFLKKTKNKNKNIFIENLKNILKNRFKIKNNKTLFNLIFLNLDQSLKKKKNLIRIKKVSSSVDETLGNSIPDLKTFP